MVLYVIRFDDGKTACRVLGKTYKLNAIPSPSLSFYTSSLLKQLLQLQNSHFHVFLTRSTPSCLSWNPLLRRRRNSADIASFAPMPAFECLLSHSVPCRSGAPGLALWGVWIKTNRSSSLMRISKRGVISSTRQTITKTNNLNVGLVNGCLPARTGIRSS